MTDLAESLDASTTTFSIPPATDRELITLWVERQDAKSLETIIRRHGRLVHSLTHKLLTSPHDRADVFQTVFLMLSQQAQKIRQRESLAMWIYGVTVRTCLMMSRQRAHAPIPDHVEAPPYPDREVLEHQELILTLNKELHLLPEHLRESLVLVYLEGHSRQTAAELMNTTEQTIKSRLARGRNLLRARLLKQGVTFTTAFTTFSLMTPSSEAAVVLPEQLIDQTLMTCQTGELSGASFTLPLDPITILPTGVPVMSSTTFYGTLAVTTLLLLTTMGLGNRGQAEGRVAAVNVETAVDDEVVSEENVTSIVKMTPATPVIQNTHAPHDVPVERSVPSETQSEEELSKSDNSLSPSNPGNSVSMQPAVEDKTQQLPDQYSFQLYLDLKLERAKLNVAITEKQLKSQEELYRRGITSSDVEQAKLNRLDSRIEYMEVLKEREVLKEVSFVPARSEASSIKRSAIGVPDSGDLTSQLILPYTEMAEEYMQNRRALLQLQISKEQPLQVSNIEDAISQSMNRLEQDLKSIEESFRAGSDDMAYQLTQIRDRVYDSLIDELTRIIEYHETQLSQSPSDDPRDQQILDHRRQTLKYLTYEKSLGSFDAVSQHIRTDLSAILFKEKPNEKLRKKLLDLREDFGPDHPEVKRVEEQLRRLEESLGERERLRSLVPEQRDDSSNRLDKSKVNIVQSLEQEKANQKENNSSSSTTGMPEADTPSEEASEKRKVDENQPQKFVRVAFYSNIPCHLECPNFTSPTSDGSIPKLNIEANLATAGTKFPVGRHSVTLRYESQSGQNKFEVPLVLEVLPAAFEQQLGQLEMTFNIGLQDIERFRSNSFCNVAVVSASDEKHIAEDGSLKPKAMINVFETLADPNSFLENNLIQSNNIQHNGRISVVLRSSEYQSVTRDRINTADGFGKTKEWLLPLGHPIRGGQFEFYSFVRTGSVNNVFGLRKESSGNILLWITNSDLSYFPPLGEGRFDNQAVHLKDVTLPDDRIGVIVPQTGHEEAEIEQALNHQLDSLKK